MGIIRDIERLLEEEDAQPIRIKIVHKSKRLTDDKSILLNKKKTGRKQRKPWKDY